MRSRKEERIAYIQASDDRVSQWGPQKRDAFYRAIARIDALSESPCIRQCRMDIDDTACLGCGRTREEISQWTKMTLEQRHQVLRRLKDLAGGPTSGTVEE